MRVAGKSITWPAVLATGVLLAGAGTAYAVAGGGGTPTYRTVTATTGEVEQTLTLTGLVDAAKRSDLAFGTDGTVAKVKVAERTHVKSGEVIATLETADLDASVTEAVATLAKARATLESDEDAQSASVSNAASGASTPSGTGKPTQGTGGNGSSAATAALLKKLKAEQDAVVAAQSAASAALSAAADALTAQTAACANAYQSSASDTPTDGSTPSDPSTATDQNAACDAALADVQDKQAAVKKAQDDLADALNELSGTLTSALGSVAQEQAAVKEMAARTAAASSAASEQQTSTNQATSGGTTVTAARLASDQAQIDQARADLITAKAARAAATLRATRSGTLVSLDLRPGDAVSTGTSVAVVVGGTAVTLTGTVAETDVAKVKVGQSARVTVPGSSTSTTGTVTAIGLTADTTTGSTTYPVTVTVPDPTIALPTGSRAQVAIVLATAKDVTTLPISAISRDGSTATVRTWNGTTLRRTVVTLGAVGSRTVAVTGIAAGTKVVVADVDQAISGASSELNNRGGFNGPPGGGQLTFRSRAGGGGAPTFSRAN